jgi:exopolysaccharide biosynthesis polyprenyl glycosylphosphotransferase
MMGTRVKRRFVGLLLAVADLVVLYGGYLLSFLILFGRDIPDRNWDAFVLLAPWMGLAALIIFNFFDLYANSNRRSYDNFLYSILLSSGLLLIVMVAVSFWVRGFAMPRSVILLGSLIVTALILLVRSIVWYMQLKMNGKKKVLIVTSSMEHGKKVTEKVFEHVKGWFEIRAVVTADKKEMIAEHIAQIDVVLITPELTGEQKAEIMSYSSRYMKEVLLVPELYELFLMGAEAQQIDDMLVFSVLPPNLSSGELLVKRIMDVVISAILLLILSPLLLGLLILIPLTSKGGPIYSQVRIGKDGKPYLIYKFRTMVKDAEKKTGPVLASDEDPRITPLGRWLRPLRIDELPQLVNVLKGDMSLVGPRPERPHFIKKYKENHPDYLYRVAVKPGITGLAQVKAKYSTTAEEKLRYDLMYIRNYTLLLDVKLLFQTLIVVLRGTQAKGISKAEQPESNLSKLHPKAEQLASNHNHLSH